MWVRRPAIPHDECPSLPYAVPYDVIIMSLINSPRSLTVLVANCSLIWLNKITWIPTELHSYIISGLSWKTEMLQQLKWQLKYCALNNKPLYTYSSIPWQPPSFCQPLLCKKCMNVAVCFALKCLWCLWYTYLSAPYFSATMNVFNLVFFI